MYNKTIIQKGVVNMLSKIAVDALFKQQKI